SVQEINELSGVDPWFLENLAEIVETERLLQPTSGQKGSEPSLRIDTREGMLAVKQQGFSDRQLALLTGTTESEIRHTRKSLGVEPVYKIVDTCAAEFAAETPYLYSSYEKGWVVVETAQQVTTKKDDQQIPGLGRDSEILPDSGKQKVMILGGGPNRIGQGIEFDYCCCHAVFALKEMGFE
ncbi:MAG TPA: carbamoyl phosphate synthase large subunit, partial [bacterium]|nr:carbamoyl phosphate synthase large subunit [bacterium]